MTKDSRDNLKTENLAGNQSSKGGTKKAKLFKMIILLKKEMKLAVPVSTI